MKSLLNLAQWLVLGLLAVCAASPPTWAEPAGTEPTLDMKAVRIGILAFRPKPETEARWRPLADYLNQQIPDARFVLNIHHLEELEAAVGRHEVDFIFTQPSHYVLLTYRNGLSSPLASLVNKEGRFGVSTFGGVIFTRADREDLNQLSDLRGKTLATAALNSLGAYQMQAAELIRAGVEMPEGVHVLETGQPQDRALDAVLDGHADAGFVRTGLIESLVAQGRLDQSRIKLIGAQWQPDFPFLVSTRLYPEWPFAALPHVPPDLARQVAAALLSMPHEGEVARQMRIAGFTIPGDYRSIDDLLRLLRQPPFDKTPKFTFVDVWRQYQSRISGLALAAALGFGLGALGLWLLNHRLRQERNRVAQSESRQKALFEALGEGVLGCDMDTRCTFINRQALAMLGYQESECLGQDLYRLVHGPHPDQPAPLTDTEMLGDRLSLAVLGHSTLHGEEIFHRQDGTAFPVAFVATPLLEKGRVTGSVLAFSDIGERKRAEARIRQLAFYDSLTGLPNRSLLIERIGQRLADLQTVPLGHALILVNIDRFKLINNARGAVTGDALLVAIGSRLAGLCRPDESLARLGGDEFALLMQEGRGLAALTRAQVLARCDQIHALMKTPYHLQGETFSISVSLGAAPFPEPNVDRVDSILLRADTALQHAKRAGGGQSVFFEPHMAALVEQRFRTERELRHAIEAGELRLFLQPQVDALGHLVGAEVLIRWQHPERGLLTPGEFIPLAEESDLIVELGAWVLSEASYRMAEAELTGLPLRLAVNISPRHFRQGGFVPWIRDVLAAANIDPSRLTLEITESLVIDNLNDVVARMNELAALGIRLSIDDFGTGYSSLAYLKRLPIHELKIDKTFVQDAPVDPNDAALVETILAIAAHMRLEVVAEGVETPTQAVFLGERARIVQQGFLYGRPEPAQVWLSRWRKSTRAIDWL